MPTYLPWLRSCARRAGRSTVHPMRAYRNAYLAISCGSPQNPWRHIAYTCGFGAMQSGSNTQARKRSPSSLYVVNDCRVAWNHRTASRCSSLSWSLSCSPIASTAWSLCLTNKGECTSQAARNTVSPRANRPVPTMDVVTAAPMPICSIVDLLVADILTPILAYVLCSFYANHGNGA